MIESFLIMLREGIEAALIVGIILVVLRKTSRRELEFPVYLGIGFAVMASIGAAFALRLLPVNEEAYEGVLYLVSGLFVASMMIWVHRQSATLKHDIESRVYKSVDASGPGGNLRESLALGGFAFLMVFREGAETVMFLSAINLRTDPLMSVIGSVIGLTLAVVFCVMFVKGSLNINLSRFFKITSWILGIFVIQLFISGYYELVEAGVFIEYSSAMAVVKPIHKGSSLITMLIVAAAMAVWFMGSGKQVSGTGGSMVQQKSLRLWALAGTVVILLALSFYFVNYKLPELTGTHETEVTEEHSVENVQSDE